MRPQERQLQITELVRSRGRISVDELVGVFQTSAETIRRDLSHLAANAKIQKVHGGAVANRNIGEGRFAQRMHLNEQAKREIAQKARKIISPGDTLFIDTGSTTLIFAEELAEIDGLTIVTNSAEIAKVLSAANDSVQVYLLGGAYNGDNRQTSGVFAVEQLAYFHGDLAFLTIAAAGEAGAMDFSQDEAQIATAMIRRADRVVIMADASKFGGTAPFVVSPWDDIDMLVCERAPDSGLSNLLRQSNVEVSC